MAKRKSRSRKGSYKMTAKRRAALKKAQIVSARKRRAAPNKRKILIGGAVGVGALSAAGVVARHKLSGSSFSKTSHPVVSGVMKNISGSHTSSLSVGKLAGGGRQLSYHSPKQGPLGNSYTLSYSHKPLRLSRSVAGQRTRSKVTDPAPQGGIKTRGGQVVLPITEFVKPKPVSIPTRDITKYRPYINGNFQRNLVNPSLLPNGGKQREATVGELSFNEYMRKINKKYGAYRG